MIWAQFKDPVSHMCLAGTVVAFCSLTQEVGGSSPFNDKYFVTEFSENTSGKLRFSFVCTRVTFVAQYGTVYRNESEVFLPNVV